MTVANLPSAVVFDLDGTLIDSLPDVVGALNALLAEERRRPVTLAEARAMIGDGASKMVERALHATGAEVAADALAPLTDRYIAHYGAVAVKETALYAGVEEVLACLASRGVAMGVCTNKPHDLSRIVLAALGIDRYFRSVVGGDVLPVRKPHPGHVHAVLDGMGTGRTGAVFVGDSAIDAQAARNAGLRSVLVAYGYSKTPVAELDPDLVIDRFGALPDALRTLAPKAALPR